MSDNDEDDDTGEGVCPTLRLDGREHRCLGFQLYEDGGCTLVFDADDEAIEDCLTHDEADGATQVRIALNGAEIDWLIERIREERRRT